MRTPFIPSKEMIKAVLDLINEEEVRLATWEIQNELYLLNNVSKDKNYKLSKGEEQ